MQALDEVVAIYDDEESGGGYCFTARKEPMNCFTKIEPTNWIRTEHRLLNDWAGSLKPKPSRINEAFKCTWIGTREVNATADRFYDLAKQWYADTGMLSIVQKKAVHPAYQRIIGMGRDALPFIFQELKRTRGHWLWALAAITGEDVAKPEQTMREAIDAWLERGRILGYL